MIHSRPPRHTEMGLTEHQQRKHRRKKRRATLRHLALTKLPIWLSRGRLARRRPGGNFQVTRRALDLPNLPDELCGLRVAHLSDPHVGELVTPEHLSAAVQAVNDLNCDLIVATGDYIDLSNSYLPAVIAAFRRLRAPLGVFFVLGNHDHIDDVRALSRAFREARLDLLVNGVAVRSCRGRTIGIAGIDWAKKRRELEALVHRTVRHLPRCDLRLLLAHHPHAFDAACDCAVDLTLSGHTHGGQVVLADGRSRRGSISLTSLTNRYPRGLYSRGPHRLHVSSGVGSWFPLRFRCPAEITELELVNRGAPADEPFAV